MKKRIKNLCKLSVVLTLLISTSCSNEELFIEDSNSTLENNNVKTSKEKLMAITSCNETSFPNLGPGATNGQAAGCNDANSPNNIGTLDCRSPHTFGGYANVGGNFGRYRITGSTQRFDGTRTRVERFFNRVDRGRNKSSTLTYEFIVDEVSSGRTCIVQAHASGEIEAGLRTGDIAKSAVFLLYVKKANRTDNRGREIYTAETHESTTPFTNVSSGNRTITFFRNLTQGIRYTLTYKTGYTDSNSQLAQSTITITGGGNTKSETLNHTYTSENVTTRYGAYEACDVCNDDRFQIRIRNVQLCREN
jgi:hypothetical protein